ncbi:MAG TPA: hypothetical protein VHN16_11065 [Streptosporangiaceae bacterium]|nr:hypothetical protein [Streptosporangiaceae bacterium]
MTRSKFYVVNAAWAGRQATHIVNGSMRTPYDPNPWHPGNLFVQLRSFGGPTTLCGLRAGRRVHVFGPEEASCRECRKRWQLRVARDAAWEDGR